MREKVYTLAEGTYNTRRIAFTLVEVLITLAIIGVVATMTVPTLVNDINDNVLEQKTKKAKALLANGYKLMIANEGGDFRIANLDFMKNCNKLENVECLSAAHHKVFKITADSAGELNVNNLPEKYLVQGNDEPSPFKWADSKYVFMTSDGTVYGIFPDEKYTSVDIVTDINNSGNPNTVKKDLYKFRLDANDGTLFDASDELLPKPAPCSIDNRSACKTEDACRALSSPGYVDGAWHWIDWRDDKCMICIGTQGGDCY